MAEVADSVIQAQSDAAKTSSSDRVRWDPELKIIVDNLIDSKVNRDEFYKETNPIATTGTFVIPMGYAIRNITFETVNTQNIKIGTAAGLDDLMYESEIDNTYPIDLVLSIAATRIANRTIYLTGTDDFIATFHLYKFYKP